MHGIDELERAPSSSGRQGFRNHPEPAAPGCSDRPLSSLLADKRSHPTPGLDARGTRKPGLDREGVTGLADRQGEGAARASPLRGAAPAVADLTAQMDEARARRRRTDSRLPPPGGAGVRGVRRVAAAGHPERACDTETGRRSLAEREEERAAGARDDRARVSWIGIVGRSLLPFHGCGRGTPPIGRRSRAAGRLLWNARELEAGRHGRIAPIARVVDVVAALHVGLRRLLGRGRARRPLSAGVSRAAGSSCSPCSRRRFCRDSAPARRRCGSAGPPRCGLA
jgi:hypothetical protein